MLSSMALVRLRGAVNFDNELEELQVGILTVTDTFRVGGADGNPEGASLIIKRVMVD